MKDFMVGTFVGSYVYVALLSAAYLFVKFAH